MLLFWKKKFVVLPSNNANLGSTWFCRACRLKHIQRSCCQKRQNWPRKKTLMSPSESASCSSYSTPCFVDPPTDPPDYSLKRRSEKSGSIKWYLHKASFADGSRTWFLNFLALNAGFWTLKILLALPVSYI